MTEDLHKVRAGARETARTPGFTQSSDASAEDVRLPAGRPPPLTEPSTDTKPGGEVADRDVMERMVSNEYNKLLPMLLEFREKGYNQHELPLDGSWLTGIRESIRSNSRGHQRRTFVPYVRGLEHCISRAIDGWEGIDPKSETQKLTAFRYRAAIVRLHEVVVSIGKIRSNPASAGGDDAGAARDELIVASEAAQHALTAIEYCPTKGHPESSTAVHEFLEKAKTVCDKLLVLLHALEKDLRPKRGIKYHIKTAPSRVARTARTIPSRARGLGSDVGILLDAAVRGTGTTSNRLVSGLLSGAVSHSACEIVENESLRLTVAPLLSAITHCQGASQKFVAMMHEHVDDLRGGKHAWDEIARFVKMAQNKVERTDKEVRTSLQTASNHMSTETLKRLHEAMAHFWAGAAALEDLAERKAMAPGDARSPAREVDDQIIARRALHEQNIAITMINGNIVRTTGSQIDLFSRDARIVMHLATSFAELRADLMQRFPGTDPALFDDILERFAGHRIVKDFPKLRSPEGKSVSSRVVTAYRDALGGTLLRPLSSDQLLERIPNLPDYLAKSGTRSLTGRLTLAGLSCSPAPLLPTAVDFPFPVLAPVKAVIELVRLPVRFQELSRSAVPGEPYPAPQLRKFAIRSAATGVARIAKSVLPKGPKLVLSGAFTVYALKRHGVSGAAKIAGGSLPVDLIWGGGAVGTTSAFNALVPYRADAAMTDENGQVRVGSTRGNEVSGTRPAGDDPSVSGSRSKRALGNGAAKDPATEVIDQRVAEEVRRFADAEEPDDIQDSLERIRNQAYPSRGLNIKTLLRDLLSEILKEHGIHDLTPDSLIEYEIVEHSAGAGETGGDAAGKYWIPPRLPRASLLDLARGALYRDNWNSHIRVKRLPPSIEGLFRKKQYWGREIFPITELLEKRAAARMDEFDDPTSIRWRKFLWQGRINRVLHNLCEIREFEALRDQLKELISGTRKVSTVAIPGDNLPINNLIAMKCNNGDTLLIDLERETAFLLPGARILSSADAEKLRRFLLPNLGLNRASFYSQEGQKNAFTPQAYRYASMFRPHLGALPTLRRFDGLRPATVRQKIVFHSAKSIDEAASQLEDAERKTAKSDIGYLITNEREMQNAQIIEFSRMALNTYAISMIFAPPGNVGVLANLGLSAGSVAVSAAAASNEEDLVRKRQETDRLYSDVVFGLMARPLEGAGKLGSLSVRSTKFWRRAQGIERAPPVESHRTTNNKLAQPVQKDALAGRPTQPVAPRNRELTTLHRVFGERRIFRVRPAFETLTGDMRIAETRNREFTFMAACRESSTPAENGASTLFVIRRGGHQSTLSTTDLAKHIQSDRENNIEGSFFDVVSYHGQEDKGFETLLEQLHHDGKYKRIIILDDPISSGTPAPSDLEARFHTRTEYVPKAEDAATRSASSFDARTRLDTASPSSSGTPSSSGRAPSSNAISHAEYHAYGRNVSVRLDRPFDAGGKSMHPATIKFDGFSLHTALEPRTNPVDNGVRELIISAHGQHRMSSASAMTVKVPAGVTLEPMTPTGTLLVDPELQAMTNHPSPAPYASISSTESFVQEFNAKPPLERISITGLEPKVRYSGEVRVRNQVYAHYGKDVRPRVYDLLRENRRQSLANHVDIITIHQEREVDLSTIIGKLGVYGVDHHYKTIKLLACRWFASEEQGLVGKLPLRIREYLFQKAKENFAKPATEFHHEAKSSLGAGNRMATLSRSDFDILIAEHDEIVSRRLPTDKALTNLEKLLTHRVEQNPSRAKRSADVEAQSEAQLSILGFKEEVVYDFETQKYRTQIVGFYTGSNIESGSIYVPVPSALDSNPA